MSQSHSGEFRTRKTNISSMKSIFIGHFSHQTPSSPLFIITLSLLPSFPLFLSLSLFLSHRGELPSWRQRQLYTRNVIRRSRLHKTVITRHCYRVSVSLIFAFSFSLPPFFSPSFPPTIPLSLSFKPWCTNDCSGKDTIYHLFAVVFHSGSSCSSGHYTACVRAEECRQIAPQDAKERFNGNGWIYFDDDQLDYISKSELLEMMSPLSISASTVYILFYTCGA